jgi:hypothetical protein
MALAKKIKDRNNYLLQELQAENDMLNKVMDKTTLDLPFMEQIDEIQTDMKVLKQRIATLTNNIISNNPDLSGSNKDRLKEQQEWDEAMKLFLPIFLLSQISTKNYSHGAPLGAEL